MTLTPPEITPKRSLARSLADATIGAIPIVGGHLEALYRVTHPSKIDQLTSQWQKDVSSSINDHEFKINQLFETITISEIAASIGYWVCKNSEFGMLEPITYEQIHAVLPDSNFRQLEDGCGELEHAQLVTMLHFINCGFRMTPTNGLFELFDPIVFEGVYPIRDAAMIAQFTLEKPSDDGLSSEQIMQKFGWNERRLNPAIRIVTDMIAEGRKSAEIYPSLECRYFYADPRERAALKHFAAKVLPSTNSQSE